MLPVPTDFETTVTAQEPLGSYFRLVFEDRGGLSRAQPGQFVNLRISENADPLLRRPFSIARILKGPRGRSQVEIVYAVVRGGTRLLSLKRPGEKVRVLGPLGNPFPHLDKKHPAILVGGGVGIPPLVFLSERLKAKGVKQWVFLGARTRKDLVHVEVFRRLKVPLSVATDDGSSGSKGFVTRLVEQHLARTPLKGNEVIHSCGPRPMLRALAAIAQKQDVPAYLSWEERMGCGLGICLTCVCPVKGGQVAGETGMARTCMEGPVFEASRIDWDKLPK